jgi:hypothetical protein
VASVRPTTERTESVFTRGVFCIGRLYYESMSRLERTLNRSKYAAIGAGIGAALGGLISRNAASTGGGIGALVGATVGEKRVDFDSFVESVKETSPRDVVSSGDAAEGD